MDDLYDDSSSGLDDLYGNSESDYSEISSGEYSSESTSEDSDDYIDEYMAEFGLDEEKDIKKLEKQIAKSLGIKIKAKPKTKAKVKGNIKKISFPDYERSYFVAKKTPLSRNPNESLEIFKLRSDLYNFIYDKTKFRDRAASFSSAIIAKRLYNEKYTDIHENIISNIEEEFFST